MYFCLFSSCFSCVYVVPTWGLLPCLAVSPLWWPRFLYTLAKRWRSQATRSTVTSSSVTTEKMIRKLSTSRAKFSTSREFLNNDTSPLFNALSFQTKYVSEPVICLCYISQQLIHSQPRRIKWITRNGIFTLAHL